MINSFHRNPNTQLKSEIKRICTCWPLLQSIQSADDHVPIPIHIKFSSGILTRNKQWKRISMYIYIYTYNYIYVCIHIYMCGINSTKLFDINQILNSQWILTILVLCLWYLDLYIQMTEWRWLYHRRLNLKKYSNLFSSTYRHGHLQLIDAYVPAKDEVAISLEVNYAMRYIWCTNDHIQTARDHEVAYRYWQNQICRETFDWNNKIEEHRHWDGLVMCYGQKMSLIASSPRLPLEIDGTISEWRRRCLSNQLGNGFPMNVA